jgi:hypothetical protein
MTTVPRLILARAFALGLLLVAGRADAATCQGGTVLPAHAGKRIVVAGDTLFFKTGDIQLDIDGSPSAYGVKDQGIEDICNGLGPLRPPECRGKVSGSCFAACRAAFRQWNGDLKTLGGVMCSIGLGGGGCSTPDPRLQAAPREEWFVSETSVRVTPAAGTTLTAWTKTQPAQLDSLTISYFVIPSSFRSLPWDATPGDIGVVVDNASGREVAFIIGDIGGKLNEGSAKLLAGLAGIDKLATETKTNALGVPVERLKGARSGDFRVAIFRHTAPLLPKEQRGRALVLDKTAQELPDWITKEVRQKLDAIGGGARVIRCTDP